MKTFTQTILAAALAAAFGSNANAAALTGGEIIFTPVLDFDAAGIQIDTFGGSYVDDLGRIHMPVVGGDLDTNDLTNANIVFAETAGLNLSRTYSAGTSNTPVTGEINISGWSLFDYGAPVDSYHFSDRESAALNTTVLSGVPLDARLPNPHDVHDPNIAPGDERMGAVTRLGNLSAEEQEFFVNGSLADGSAQADGRFVVPQAQFHSNQTFGLVQRADVSQTTNDGYLNDVTYDAFTNSVESGVFLEILENYHLRINAQAVLGLSEQQAQAVGFVNNASLFMVHAEGLQFAAASSSGSGAVPAPGGLALLLIGAAILRRQRRG